MKRLPFVFALAIIAGELLLACLLWFGAPSGTRWLGNTIMNSSDAAVYLSYLQQGMDGHILLHSLYAVESNAARLDLVWSTLGALTRFVPALVVQEGARVIFTLILIVAVFAAASALTSETRDARHATYLAFGGAGGGVLFSIWLGALHLWTSTTYPAIDLASEFAIAPILIGGVHMILSLALLITTLRFSWNLGQKDATKKILLAAVSAGILFSFHPYFVPLCVVFLLIAIAYRWKTSDKKQLFTHIAILCLSAIPAAIVYVPLAFDPVFRTHHLQANILPLPPFLAWALPILPFVIALVWRWKNRILYTEKEYWLVAWIFSALICIALPFPWKRKFLEGLDVACVFLSLPMFFAMRDWVMRGPNRWINALTGFILLIAAWMAPMHLLTSQLAWIEDPHNDHYFYQPVALFNAWTFLHDHTPTTAVVTSDDFWGNLWIASYAGRITWIAHDHETPDFARKHDAWKQLMTTTDATEARRILSENNIDDLLLTSDASQQRFASLLGTSWITAFHKDRITVLEPRPVFSNLARSCQNGACVAP